MSLNELESDMKGQLCPTDSRLRPDVRLLEQGDIDAAATEKTRLEDKQRTCRKAFKKSSEPWQARYLAVSFIATCSEEKLGEGGAETFMKPRGNLYCLRVSCFDTSLILVTTL